MEKSIRLMTGNIPANWKLSSWKIFQRCLKSLYSAVEDILSFLSVSSLFIGGHGFFKTYAAFILLGFYPNLLVCSVVFLISFSVYTLDKIADIDKDTTNMPQRYKFLHKRKRLMLFCAVASYLLAVLLTLLYRPIALPVVFIPFIANAFYATKIHRSLPRLKDIPVAKNLIVALAWALVTTLFPAIFLDSASNATILAVVYFMLIKTLVDNVLYDIRDIKGDCENGVRTMAVLLGKHKTVALLLGANSTLLPITAFTTIAAKPLAMALAIYGYLYIIYFQERRNPLALDFFVEGEWMLMAALLIFIKIEAGI
jgi:4-hydroxybenzoate polyprenyltransferase